MARLYEHEGEFVNDGEKRVVYRLLEELPDDHLIIPNVTFYHRNNSVDEIDALVVGPRWATVVEIKDYAGRVSFKEHEHKVNGEKRSNAVVVTSNKAKRLVGRFSSLSKKPWIGSQVVLAREPQLLHIADEVSNQVTQLDFAAARLQNQERMVPAHINPHQIDVEKFLGLLNFESRKVRHSGFGQYRILKMVEETESETLYLAEHEVTEIEQHLRVYKIDPALSSSDKKQKTREAWTAWTAAERINDQVGWTQEILGPKTTDKTDAGDVFVVLPLPYGPRLNEFLDGLREEKTSLDADLGLLIIRDVANALKAAHAVGISHRALSTSSIYIDPTADCSSQPIAKLGFWDKAFLEQTSTGKTRMVDGLSARFLPPEIAGEVEEWALVDLYALGVCIKDIWERIDTPIPQMLSELQAILCENNPLDRDIVAAEVVDKIESLLSEGASLEEETSENQTGLLGGKYQVIEVLGKGGSGEVFSTYDTYAEQHFALKKFHGDAALEVAKREFGALMDLRHRNIVRVYDIESLESHIYLKMELLKGVSLRKRIAEGEPVSFGLAAEWFLNLLEALDELHSANMLEERKLVHRDIKPENLLVEDQPRGLVLVDFGIASMSSGEVAGGTGRYRSVDYGFAESIPAMDLFSLAVVFHETLTCDHPFGSKPTCQGEPTITCKFPPLENFFQKALSSDLSRRFITAKEMRDELLSVASEHRTTSERPRTPHPPPSRRTREVGTQNQSRRKSGQSIPASEILTVGSKVKLGFIPGSESRTAIASSGGQAVEVEVVKAVVTASPNIRLEIELLTTTYGEAWIQAVNANKSPKPIQRLVHGLRPTISPVPGSEGLSFMQLRQAKIVNDPDWPKIRQVSLEDLNLGAGEEITPLLLKYGAEKIDDLKNIHQNSNKSKSGLCVVFKNDNIKVPLLTYVLTRVAPLVPPPNNS